jgi:hypothetical protein
MRSLHTLGVRAWQFWAPGPEAKGAAAAGRFTDPHQGLVSSELLR